MADSFLLRLRGLLFRPPLAQGEGLYLDHCNCIHMFGMAYAIDAIFLDRQMRVVGLVDSIGPCQVSKVFKTAHACLELPAGTISDTATAVGDELEVT